MRWGASYENDLERVITETRRQEQLEAFALLAFTREELGELSLDRRRVLDLLLKRHLRLSLDPSLADALQIRRQFEDFCDSQSANAAAIRHVPVLRR